MFAKSHHTCICFAQSSVIILISLVFFIWPLGRDINSVTTPTIWKWNTCSLPNWGRIETHAFWSCYLVPGSKSIALTCTNKPVWRSKHSRGQINCLGQAGEHKLGCRALSSLLLWLYRFNTPNPLHICQSWYQSVHMKLWTTSAETQLHK